MRNNLLNRLSLWKKLSFWKKILNDSQYLLKRGLNVFLSESIVIWGERYTKM